MFGHSFNIQDIIGMLNNEARGMRAKDITKEVVVEASKPLDGHFETFREGVSGAIVMEINPNPKTQAIKMMYIPNISTNVLMLTAGDGKVLTTEMERTSAE